MVVVVAGCALCNLFLHGVGVVRSAKGGAGRAVDDARLRQWLCLEVLGDAVVVRGCNSVREDSVVLVGEGRERSKGLMGVECTAQTGRGQGRAGGPGLCRAPSGPGVWRPAGDSGQWQGWANQFMGRLSAATAPRPGETFLCTTSNKS